MLPTSALHKPAGTPNWLDRRLFPFTSHWLPIEGHMLHYIDEGVGSTLLLLHGNPTWSFLIPAPAAVS